MRTKLTSGLSMFAPRSSLLFMEPFFKLDSNMWGFASHRKTTFAKRAEFWLKYSNCIAQYKLILERAAGTMRSLC